MGGGLMDMRPLSGLVHVPGPFISVYLDNSRQRRLRWRGIAEKLWAQGADSATLEAVETAVLQADQPAGRALLAAGGRVLVDKFLPKPPLTPMARTSELPYLLPLATVVSGGAVRVTVVVDRTGIRVIDDHGNEVQGLPGCTAALRAAAVEMLLVSSRIHEHTVCTGSVPNLVAACEEDLLGPVFATRRADEALPFAALAVGADIQVTNDHLLDGVAVTLR